MVWPPAQAKLHNVTLAMKYSHSVDLALSEKAEHPCSRLLYQECKIRCYIYTADFDNKVFINHTTSLTT